MCGPSSAETGIENTTEQMGNTLSANYNTLFSDQLGVLNGIKASLNPISAAGPSQNGFSGAELSNLQEQAIAASGGAAASAAQAARTAGAGEGGGGTSGLTSGIQKQIDASIASQGANAEAAQLGKINLANEQQGNENYWRAQGGQQALANAFNPSAAESGMLNAENSAFGEADKINQESNAEAQDIAGFATSALGAASDFATGGGLGAVKGFFGGGGPGGFSPDQSGGYNAS